MGDYRGAGARVAVFDTGIDADVNGTVAGTQSHPAFLDMLGATRIAAHLRAQDINDPSTRQADVNACQVSGASPFVGATGPFGWRAGRHHQNAAHGTTMAAIIAGRPYSLTNPTASFPDSGHAPDAMLVDVSASSYPQGVPPAPSDASLRWEFTDAGYLGGIEALRTWILMNRPASGPTYIHVLNLSIGGEASPFHPINVALDALARDEDILLVTIAGNLADTTVSSPGFYHGVAVGAVHARSDESPINLAFVPAVFTATGPLAGDPARLFPDVCATGAGPGYVSFGPLSRGFYYPYDLPASFDAPQVTATCLSMPGIDVSDVGSRSGTAPPNNVSPSRRNVGTSEAAAQVSGAAALYRGYRAAQGTPATGEEARAAILLNVLGTSVAANGTTADTSAQHTYTNRNRLGVGYVRDDLLAQFAVRDATIKPLATVATVSLNAPLATATYASLTAGKRYGVTACWRRLDTSQHDLVNPDPLPNVDLEILFSGSVVARSCTPANSYERVVFVCPPGGGTATIRISLVSTPLDNQPIVVTIAAREFADEIDGATTVLDPAHAATGQTLSAPAGAGCTATSREWQVDRIVPTSYANAYGSAPFEVALASLWYTHSTYARGFDLALGRVATWPVGTPSHTIYISIDNGEMGAAMDIAGLAFRAWTPFATGTDLTVVEVKLDNAVFPAVSAPVTVASGVTLRSVGVSAGETVSDRFSVLLPFSTTYSYDGMTPLTVAIKVAPSAPVFRVDGLKDGVAPAPWYRTTYQYYNSGPTPGLVTVTLDGEVPILGLIAANSPSTALRVPLLETFGEPFSGNGSAVREVAWRLTQVPPGSVWVLNAGGWTATPSPIGPCSQWLVNPVPIAYGSASTGIEFGRFPIPLGTIHSEFGLQAVLLVPPPDVLAAPLSNAVRVMVGGGL